MKILAIEPFYGGSHKQFIDGLIKYSSHKIELFSLKDVHWKWRMACSGITLGRRYLENKIKPDLIFANDMLNLNDFVARTRIEKEIPIVLYMHENQITYPFAKTTNQDFHYGLINFKSCICASEIWFNSEYHKTVFFEELPNFLKKFPSPNEKIEINNLLKKSKVMSLGLELLSNRKEQEIEKYNRAVILWNHRWEHDKNPEQFFNALKILQSRGIEFKLIVVGESYERKPEIFEQIPELFKNELIHFGYAESKETYFNLLNKSDILPVTSKHDFFGISVVEAMNMNVIPLLPKRLAYPEHIPSAYERTFFYDDDKEFVNKLQRMIMNVAILRKQNTSQFVEKYDWKNMILNYDDAFEKLITTFA